MANIKESSAFVFDPTDGSQLIDGGFNISKIDDPIEFKRLNTYLTTVLNYNYDGNRRANLAGIRQKLNTIGFDFDLPKTVSESDKFTMRAPLKRFGGISGMGDDGKTFDNPYGPGPKFDISFQTVGGILSAKIIPVGATYSTDSMQEMAPAIIPAIVTGARVVGSTVAKAANSPAGREAIGAVASTMASKAIDKISKKKENPAMNEHKEIVEELLNIIDALCEELGIDAEELLAESQKDGNIPMGRVNATAVGTSQQGRSQYEGSFVERLKRTHSALQQVPHHERDEGWNDVHSNITDLLNRHAAGENITPPESAARESEAGRQSERRNKRYGVTPKTDEDEGGEDSDVPDAPETKSDIDVGISAAAKKRKEEMKKIKSEREGIESQPGGKEAYLKRLSQNENISFANVMKRYLK
jgi:hypothetical protein